ncbi:uncharacterized protein LOC130965901 [Arachis stenosperma]|uniref:uncharacterized protein LOC130965901 n=1 Tax=Arachis stenosperma TaxID=217475 RepID=UPI0025ACD605|nr:uncharacterized protein LOC130965901 [Arachis stenosperma]
MTNQDQKVAYDEIMGAVHDCVGGFFFVYGYGQVLLNVASSGMSSLLLPNGRTAHSRFKVPLSIGEDSICDINPGSSLARLISFSKLIIWDEAPILIVVLSEDFRHILPVVPFGSSEDIVRACKVLELRQNMRLSRDYLNCHDKETMDFATWLLQVGDGLFGDNIAGESKIQTPHEFLLTSEKSLIGDLVDFAFPNMLNSLSNYDFFKKRCILVPTLDVVSEVNTYVMSLIPSERKEYLSSDYVCTEEGNMEAELYTMSPEMLNLINFLGIPQHKLELKFGVPIMLLRNIDQSNGLCNGIELQVWRLGDHVVECLILIGRNVGDVVLIPRMNLVPNNKKLAVKFTRRQFPLMLSFAMTINKSQE